MVRKKAREAPAGEAPPPASAPSPGRSWTRWAAGAVTALAAALLLASRQPTPDVIESARGAPDQAFASAAIPLVRKFVKSKYKDYGQGKVTLRHLKEHIVKKSKLGLTYEDLRDDRYSAIIEDEVDAIVARCDGGKNPSSCVELDA
ncbi:unnamed protein product [Effrenium voratum]|uniref:Uncharacterized protein n=1 Tax=Effrenium voratum TaxID=2562239 RepID=A0AA36MWS2_9DINO|nr:unnamed protein product [Effrenium voratum]CAJ1452731.1 unnamed protein product [Effrenium voratum]